VLPASAARSVSVYLPAFVAIKAVNSFNSTDLSGYDVSRCLEREPKGTGLRFWTAHAAGGSEVRLGRPESGGSLEPGFLS
jgi:hypothetical protein